MESHSLKPDLGYLKRLAGAGWDGFASARQEMRGGMFSPPLETAVWTPAALGAAIGMVGTRLLVKRKSASSAAVGGLVGSLVGCGAAIAWSSRRYTNRAAHRAARLVNAARDAHWLESHPIDYA